MRTFWNKSIFKNVFECGIWNLTQLKNFYLIYKTICNGKKKGELVECRLCLEDTICHASLFHKLYYSLKMITYIFSCPVGVDNTFCCSKVKYSLLFKVTEFFTAVSCFIKCIRTHILKLVRPFKRMRQLLST